MTTKKATTEKKAVDEIVVYSENQIQAKLQEAGGAKELVDIVKNHVKDFKGDASTEAGRKEIKSIAAKVVKSKTTVEKIGKELTKSWREATKKVNEEIKYVTGELDALRDEIKMPVTLFEEEEKRKQKELEDRVEAFNRIKDQFSITTPMEQLEEKLQELQAIDIENSGFGDLEYKAFKYITEATNHIKNVISEINRRAKEAAEKARIEEEKRIEREAREKAEKENEELRKRLAALESKEQKQEEVKEGSGEEPEEEIKEEPKKKEEQKTPRFTIEEDTEKAHRKLKNREALEAFIANGLDEAVAKKVITLVATGKVPNITINY